MEKIDLWAFEGCSSLVNVDWSNATSLTTLGEAVFRACVNLESITLPNSVDGYLPDMLFLGCASLKTFNFPTSVDAIGYNTFNGCTSITEMNIPSGVTRIASSPFEGCTSLKTLTIPDTVEKLYFDINNGCAALETINFNATNCSFYNTTDSAYFAPIFVNDSNFIVNFGNNVQKIPECMFDSNTKIKSLNLPSSIIEIGINAFKGCTGLTTITIPTNVTNIGEYAFAECVNVNTLNFNATACGSFKNTGYVFEKLGLNVGTTVNIGANVQKIPDYFLHYNTNTPNVQTVNFADSSACTVIGGFAFYKTSFSSVNLPDSLKTIGSNAFEASGISSVSIPSALEFIGDDAFKDCVLLSTVSNFGNSSVQLIRGFYGCYNLSSITLPSNAISIEENAFRDCSSIETINIPNSIITISNHAFDGCSALTSFDIPESVSALGEYILNNTTSLLRINYNSQHFYEESFEECYVFAGAGATSGCSLNVGSSVRCIPDYMFSYSYGENYISSVSFSNYSDCYYIGEHAFYACESLKEIEIPENLYNIGYEAFAYCVNLETINYEAYALGYNEDEGSIIFLEDACAFYDAGSSTDGGITINFANSVALVPRFLFGIYGNYGGPCITNINFSQVEGENCIIDMYAFYGQTNLTSITLSNNVCRIYEGAFTLCENVEYCSFSSFDCIRDDKIDWIIYQDVGEFTSNSPNDSRTFDHDSEEEYLTSCFEFFHEFLSPEDYVCSYFTLYGYDYDDNIGFYLI